MISMPTLAAANHAAYLLTAAIQGPLNFDRKTRTHQI